MKQNSSRLLPVWLISALVGAAMISPIIAYLLFRRPPSPPTAVVVSGCRDLAPGMRRVSGYLGIKFDVPEPAFDLNSGTSDMPPQTFYDVTVKNRSTATLQISEGPERVEEAWKSAWPVFSKHIDPALASGPLASPEGYEERDVRNVYGRVVGKDRWGDWKRGERWRFVEFGLREEAGYLPTPLKEAQLLDQVISTACFSAAPSP